MNNILQLLGLAYKGKRIIIGDDILTSLRQNKKLSLIIIANDVSENTLKKFKDKANFYKIDYIVLFSKEELGKSLGKNYVSAVGICDKKLKEKILNESRWFICRLMEKIKNPKQHV